jgi:hypothetical protein
MPDLWPAGDTGGNGDGKTVTYQGSQTSTTGDDTTNPPPNDPDPPPPVDSLPNLANTGPGAQPSPSLNQPSPPAPERGDGDDPLGDLADDGDPDPGAGNGGPSDDGGGNPINLFGGGPPLPGYYSSGGNGFSNGSVFGGTLPWAGNPKISWPRDLAAIIKITKSASSSPDNQLWDAVAGKTPSYAQFRDAVGQVLTMCGGDSSAAFRKVNDIRQLGTDNALLAALDHYFNTRAMVESSHGLLAAPLLVLNVGYCGLKAVAIPVGQDSTCPPWPVSELQWAAGNDGVIDGLVGPDE